MTTKEEVTGIIDIYLNVTCPKCDHTFDALIGDDDFVIMRVIFRNDSSEIAEKTCPKCQHEFLIKLEY